VLALQVIPGKAADGDYAGIMDLWRSLTTDPMLPDAPQEAEGGMAEIPIIAIGFSVAALKLRGDAAPGSHVAAAVLALGGVSGTVPAAEKFHRAASLIEDAFASVLAGGQLVEMGNKQETTAFHVISYLGAMFKLGPADAFRAVCAILPALKGLPKGMYRVLVVPFVRSFWRVAIERDAFAFSAPRLVERQINEALGIEGEASLLPLLTAVGRGLGVSAPHGLEIEAAVCRTARDPGKGHKIDP
jgi:hypothetical protein